MYLNQKVLDAVGRRDDFEKLSYVVKTIKSFENNKKELTWGNFITIILLLMQNEETKPLVEVMGLYPEDLKNFLTII